MMATEAWCSLSGNERAIYVEIESRYAGPGSTNGRIGYSVRDAAESLRIGKTTAGKALGRLQERGFIVAMKVGAFSRKLRHATEWRLTIHNCDVTGELAPKDFARWAPEIQNTVPSQTSKVPDTGPIGTRRRTDHLSNSQIGT